MPTPVRSGGLRNLGNAKPLTAILRRKHQSADWPTPEIYLLNPTAKCCGPAHGNFVIPLPLPIRVVTHLRHLDIRHRHGQRRSRRTQSDRNGLAGGSSRFDLSRPATCLCAGPHASRHRQALRRTHDRHGCDAARISALIRRTLGRGCRIRVRTFVLTE